MAGAKAPKERIELKGPLDLALPDGSTVTVRPGPHGKGISVIARPLRRAAGPGAGSGSRGRPPRPSTVELRAILQKDAAAGNLKDARHYIDWLVSKEPKASRATLQQTAYRELRAVGGGAGRRRRGKGRKSAPRGGGKRGRAPHPATTILRERLQKDSASGSLQPPAAYIRFLVEKANVGIKRARPIVYRELRLAKSH